MTPRIPQHRTPQPKVMCAAGGGGAYMCIWCDQDGHWRDVTRMDIGRRRFIYLKFPFLHISSYVFVSLVLYSMHMFFKKKNTLWGSSIVIAVWGALVEHNHWFRALFRLHRESSLDINCKMPCRPYYNVHISVKPILVLSSPHPCSDDLANRHLRFPPYDPCRRWRRHRPSLLWGKSQEIHHDRGNDLQMSWRVIVLHMMMLYHMKKISIFDWWYVVFFGIPMFISCFDLKPSWAEEELSTNPPSSPREAPPWVFFNVIMVSYQCSWFVLVFWCYAVSDFKMEVRRGEKEIWTQKAVLKDYPSPHPLRYIIFLWYPCVFFVVVIFLYPKPPYHFNYHIEISVGRDFTPGTL